MSFAAPLCLSGQGVAEIGHKLMQMPLYQCDARFEVLLPSASDPVSYDVTLQSSLPAAADSLAPCDYLIRWSTTSPSGPLEGFSAYFDGNHYRYRNNRLQEYHIDGMPSAFMPSGAGSQAIGVQNQAQFADMLPQFLGQKLVEMSQDTCYRINLHPDTLVSGRRSVVIEGNRVERGYETLRFMYVLDHYSLLPVYTDLETSPGMISEQIIDHYYSSGSQEPTIELSEEGLIEAWPEVFEKYRESTFRVESLVGEYLPSFTAPIYGSQERYSHMRGEGLDAASILVVIDPEIQTAPATIAAVRDAIAMSPENYDVIWAFRSNNEAEIAQLLGALQPGEKALQSIGSLLRNCGIGLFPTLMIIDSEGVVKDVLTGYNNDLASLVIQKIALMK